MTKKLLTSPTLSWRVWLILGLLILLWTGMVGFFTVDKLHNFGYDALDLGIYTQVFHYSAQGDLFEFTIHPHSYLGDHVELFILLLLPLYMLWPGPEMLLVMQALFVALGIVPLFLLARKILPRPQWSWLVIGAYLCYPIIWNMSFFEFHLLSFAIPLLLWLFYVYYTRRFAWFIILSVLALTVREDVALVVGMFGVLAWIEKRSWQWRLTPIIMGGTWFIMAMQITGYFNQSGSYKFLSLYSWLGDTPREIIITALTKPWRWLIQIFSLNNLMLILGMTFPLAALPLLHWKYYIPAALIFLQLFLAPFSATLMLETHYTALLVPFIFIAGVFALAQPTRLAKKIFSRLKTFQPLPMILLVVAVTYSFVTLSPLSSAWAQDNPNDEHTATMSIKNDLIHDIASTEPVIAGFDMLPLLADRDRAYSMHYAFLGHRQYTDVPFDIPRPISSLIFDATDFIVYQLQSGSISAYHAYYDTGYQRIQRLIAQNNLSVAAVADSIVLYQAGTDTVIRLYQPNTIPGEGAVLANETLDNTLTLVAWHQTSGEYKPALNSGQLLPMQLYWRPQKRMDTDYQIQLQLRDASGTIAYSKYYPLGYGLMPTSTWPAGQTMQTNHWFVIPEQYPLSELTPSIQVVTLDGYMTLDAARSTAMQITEVLPLGDAIPLTTE